MPRKKILPEEIQNIVDQVREKEQKEDAKEFGLVKIDATDSIHKKQVEIRVMLKKVLEEKGVII